MTSARDEASSYIADAVDRAILRHLQADARRPFSSIAADVGVSDKTVARRYQRLRRLAGVRVIAVSDPAPRGRELWLLRIRVDPVALDATLAHLERRDDTAWINYLSGPGGLEITLMAYREPGSDRSVIDQIRTFRGVESLVAYQCIQMFFGGPQSLLDNGASAQTATRTRPQGPSSRPSTSANDRRLIDVLEVDGRASIAQLSRASGLDEDTVARRIASLTASGSYYFDVDFRPELLGYTVSFAVWATVRPADLEHAGRALADHDEISFAAATTGDSNLYAMAHCVDTAAMAAYIVGPLADIPGLSHVTTAPVLRAIKRARRDPRPDVENTGRHRP